MNFTTPYLKMFRDKQSAWLFDSTVTIVRPDGYVDGDGRTVQASTTVVYTGEGQVLKPEAVHRQETIGAEPTAISTYQATVPHHVDVRAKDLLTVNTSADTALEGRTFRVVEVRRTEWLVNRRMTLEETQ